MGPMGRMGRRNSRTGELAGRGRKELPGGRSRETSSGPSGLYTAAAASRGPTAGPQPSGRRRERNLKSLEM
jgi:hypothetical protein